LYRRPADDVKAFAGRAVTQVEYRVYERIPPRGRAVSNHNHTIGNYMGKPIFESIEIQDDTYVFDRIAQYEDDEFPLDRLSANELLVEPGLIYRHKK
jgi:hypothetical protein